MTDALSWLALAVILFVILTLVYGIIAVQDVPYRIAKARNHPHQAAIQAGGWISLFTLHAIWPVLWIWAMAYDPTYGYAGDMPAGESASPMSLPRRIVAIETQLNELRSTETAKSTGSTMPKEPG